jgi:hypothetical protein
VTLPTRARSRLNAAAPDASDTCCSRMNSTRVSNPGWRCQNSGSPNRSRAAAACRRRRPVCAVSS